MPNLKFVKFFQKQKRRPPKIFFKSWGGEDLLHLVGRGHKITRMTGCTGLSPLFTLFYIFFKKNK